MRPCVHDTFHQVVAGVHKGRPQDYHPTDHHKDAKQKYAMHTKRSASRRPRAMLGAKPDDHHEYDGAVPRGLRRSCSEIISSLVIATMLCLACSSAPVVDCSQVRRQQQQQPRAAVAVGARWVSSSGHARQLRGSSSGALPVPAHSTGPHALRGLWSHTRVLRGTSANTTGSSSSSANTTGHVGTLSFVERLLSYNQAAIPVGKIRRPLTGKYPPSSGEAVDDLACIAAVYSTCMHGVCMPKAHMVDLVGACCMRWARAGLAPCMHCL